MKYCTANWLNAKWSNFKAKPVKKGLFAVSHQRVRDLACKKAVLESLIPLLL